MNKLLTLSLAFASIMAFEGCASQSSIRVTEINSYNHAQSAHVRIQGAANMQILGPVFVKTENRCVVSDVVKAATAKYKNVSDLVNIRMEETSNQTSTNTTYSCKYSALAVNYKSVSPEELRAWKALYANDNADSAVVEDVIENPLEEDASAEKNTEYAVEEANAPVGTDNDAFYTR